MGERGSVVGKVDSGDGGWPWIEMNYAERRGKIVICGFGIIEKWAAGPTPRYMFVKLLESLDQRVK